MSDNMSHPTYYASGEIECKDAMREAMGEIYCLQPCAEGYGESSKNIPPIAFYWWGRAFEHLWRWPKKDGFGDLRKCKQCIDFIIEEMEGKNED